MLATSVMSVHEMRARLQSLSDAQTAQFAQRFFKTGPGEYGEGDIFLGVRVPELRKLAKEFSAVSLDEAISFLRSSYHEERLLALLMLVRLYLKGDQATKEKVYQQYLKNTRFINNWDLVDLSAPQIVGAHLWEQDRKPLSVLAQSDQWWERRIAIMATFHFIRQGEYAETLRLAKRLLTDQEDLIHKAVGWMLREIGKRDLAGAESFLREHYQRMPRTMLRYAIEKFPEVKRQKYLKGCL